MAVRSGAGTGVIVSLVVFILTTIFLLILTIVFYSGKTKALEAEATATSSLDRYVKPQERNSDVFRGFEQAARDNGQSVAGFLKARQDAVMRYLNGDAGVPLEQVKAELARFGVEEDAIVRDALSRMRSDLRSRDTEIESKQARIKALADEVSDREAQIARMKNEHQEELELVSREIVTYREQAESYGDQVRQTVATMNRSVDRMRDQYEDRIAELEDEIDSVSRELVLMRSRVDEFEAIFNETRIRGKSPELLVDGKVLDVDPASDQVYINLGKEQRIVLGMTFEVYDDFASIRVDESGRLPRGKASLQVVKVGSTTSTCKLTRSVPGRPVIRDNVIANAIYDPDHRFKFLVHGKFDVDGDGRPSEAEADHLRSLVVEWGGEVVEGDELPGDLDFLVMGEMPPMPPALRPDATDAQIRISVEKRSARLKYEELFRRASEAQIPVLNANRFFILIGHTQR